MLLDVDRSLCLDGETDETHDEKEGGVDVSLPSCRLGFGVRVAFVEGGTAPGNGGTT